MATLMTDIYIPGRRFTPRDLFGQLQHGPVLHMPLSVVKSLYVALTVTGIAGTVDRYKSIIYTVGQVHPKGGEGGSWMTTAIKRTEGHYEVQKTSYGEAYVWCPECVMVECDCGERPVLSASETVCSCGTDHAVLIRGLLSASRAPHPWDAEYREWREQQDEYLLSEEIYWLEQSRLD
jgi:hypothetical protein